jgi:hypothetical protein
MRYSGVWAHTGQLYREADSKATVAYVSILAPGESTWIGWKVTWDDVWVFWVDTSHSYLQGVDRILEIVHVRNKMRVAPDPSGVPANWARINVKNVGAHPVGGWVRVARIF